MPAQLQPGTMLDGRYRIDSVLGQGGFGITYAAENTRIGRRVAVKELFWRGFTVRAGEDRRQVAIADPADAEIFEAQKRRFLQEARIVRGFAHCEGIADVLDYFEENGTAYIVMEYVEGRTLAACAAERTMSAEDLLRRFLPLIGTLEQIHQAGVIHRDISPDNVIVQPDGSLKLIDFGAARHFLGQTAMTAPISRENYSPCELYSRDGRLGPWTDVYALCATLYACVARHPPQSSPERMMLDELEPPSAGGADIAPAFEAVLMKGLAVRPEDRYQSMRELSEAVAKALPKPPEPSRIPRRAKWAACAALSVLLLLGAAWGCSRYRAAHRFSGIRTERFRFTAEEETTVSEFVAAREALRSRLDDFSGKGNYLLEENGTALDVTLPLDAFEGQEIGKTLDDRFSGLVPGRNTKIRHEIVGVWEEPEGSLFAGDYQVAESEMAGEGLICVYSWYGELTEGQRANMIADFKARLDALETPYAFGTLYGDPDRIVFRIGAERIGAPILDCLGLNGLSCGWKPWGTSSNGTGGTSEVRAVKGQDGRMGLQVTFPSELYSEKLREYTGAMADFGLGILYLKTFGGGSLAAAPVTGAVTDGAVEFYDFCLEGMEALGEDSRWLPDFLAACAQQTELPVSASLEDWVGIDETGSAMLDGYAPHLGVRYQDVEPQRLARMRERLNAISGETGYSVEETEDSFRLYLRLPADETLPGRIADLLPELIRGNDLGRPVYDKSLTFVVTNPDDAQCLAFITTEYSHTDKRFRNVCDIWLGKEGIKKPWAEQIRSWWEAYDWEALGLTRWEME